MNCFRELRATPFSLHRQEDERIAMADLNKSAERFLSSYQRRYRQFQRKADLLRDVVSEIARGTGALVHATTARAKTPESVRSKLRRKHYRNPDSQFTDLIGVRVITIYSDDVDLVVARIREDMIINKRDSVDERVLLGLRDFGYRSVHLIARLKASQVRAKKHQILRNQWFEIQVRSILEHAWAEISHEIVYKSGVQYPEEMIRRFASMAGTLELLDNEFLTLRDERNDLIDHYRDTYAKNEDDRKAFDVARLMGFLEAHRPEGQSWRQAAHTGAPFHPGLDTSCVEALKAVGLGTPKSLGTILKSCSFDDAVVSYAAAHGIAPGSVSHLAVVLLALIVKNASVIKEYFPEILFDPAIDGAVRKYSSK